MRVRPSPGASTAVSHGCTGSFADISAGCVLLGESSSTSPGLARAIVFACPAAGTGGLGSLDGVGICAVDLHLCYSPGAAVPVPEGSISELDPLPLQPQSTPLVRERLPRQVEFIPLDRESTPLDHEPYPPGRQTRSPGRQTRSPGRHTRSRGRRTRSPATRSWSPRGTSCSVQGIGCAALGKRSVLLGRWSPVWGRRLPSRPVSPLGRSPPASRRRRRWGSATAEVRVTRSSRRAPRRGSDRRRGSSRRRRWRRRARAPRSRPR